MITVFSVKPSCLLLLLNTLCVHSLETLITVWPVMLTVNTCVHMHTRVLRVLAVRGVLHVIVRHLHLLLSPDAHQLLVVHVSDLLHKHKQRKGGSELQRLMGDDVAGSAVTHHFDFTVTV